MSRNSSGVYTAAPSSWNNAVTATVIDPDVWNTLLDDIESALNFGTTGATDNRLLRADGTGGLTIQSSAVTVDDSGNMSGVGTLGAGAITSTGLLTVSLAGNTARFINTTDNASVQAARLEGDRATMAANDEAYLSLMLSDSGGTQTEFARLSWMGTTVTDTSEAGRLDFAVMTAGSLADELSLDGTAVFPSTNDGLALGKASTGEFSDLFGASGFVWNIANGDWAATHSTGVLTVGTGDLRVTTAGTNTASVVTVGGTQTLTNKTLTSPTLTTPTLTVNDDSFTVRDNADTTKQLNLQLSGITTGNTRTLTVPDASTTIVGTDATQTLTNKTLALGSNTVSGTIAQFNTAVTDADFATLAGSETLSNKTLTAPKFADLGFIADANGNELIILDTVTSAVNEVTLANAATTGSPTLSATGGDTNIDLTLSGKGTGGVVATFKNATGLAIYDSDSSHGLRLSTSSNLTAARTLTLVPGDSDRTLTISGNATVSQDYSSTGSPTFANPLVTTLEVGHASDTTLARASAGIITVEGNTIWHAGNDGAGSGLDADLLDGKNIGTSGNVVPLLDGANTWSGQQTFSLGSAATTEPIRALNTTDNASVQVLQLEGDRATMAANDEAYISLLLSDSAGNQDEFARLTWRGTTVTNTSEAGRLAFSVVTAGSLAEELYLTGAELSPAANDGLALGSTALGWADLHAASGFTLNVANGNAVVTHSSGIFTVSTGDWRITTAGTNTASAVTVGGTQTLTNKTLTSPTLTSPTISTSPTAAGATWTDLGAVTTADINGGTLDGVTIGGSSAAAATLTALSVGQTTALTGDISPSQITADQNDYNPTGLSTASVLRLSSDASRNITGLQGGADGRLIIIHNVGAQNIVLVNASASSSAANRFSFGGDLTLAASAGVILRYDATDSRWYKVADTLVGAGGGGGAPDNAQYIVAASDATLTAERVATDTSTVSWDFATGGQAKASIVAASVNATHVATSIPGFGFDAPINLGISATVAGNALTIAIKGADGNDASSSNPVIIPFRSPTAATGTPVVRSLTAALSLAVSSGSTLGTTNSAAFRLTVAIFDDGGTLRVGVINATTMGVNEGAVASSTAEGGAGAADSANTWYTGSAVTSKAFRIVGYLDYPSGLATAGTWSAAPTTTQIYGDGVVPQVITPPKVTQYTSGSGTHTVATGCKWLRVICNGAGGGSSGSGTGAGAGGNGGNTTFGSVTANGGAGGSRGDVSGTGGAGGSASGGDVNLSGQLGGGGQNATSQPGGFGGGSGNIGIWTQGATPGAAGVAGVANTAAGAGGAGSGSASPAGGGGGGGGFALKVFKLPDSSYSYAVGAGGSAGSAGTSGFAGAAGGSGNIVVEEFFT